MDGDEHKVQFLRDMFPFLTPDTIKQRIKSAPQQSDVDSLVTYFLGFYEDPSNSVPNSTSPIVPIFSALLPDLSDSDVIVVEDENNPQEKPKKKEEKKEGEDGDEVFEMITFEPTTWNDGSAPKGDTPFESVTTTTTTSTKDMPTTTPKPTQKEPSKTTEKFQKPTPNSSRSSFLASIHEKRLSSRSEGGNVVDDRKVTSSSVPSYYDQIKSIREKHRSQWKSTSLGKKRVWSLRDLEEYEQHNKFGSDSSSQSKKHNSGVHTFQNTIYDPVRIGKEALEYTNDFRKEQKLPPLKWHAGLYPIACKHSKDMAEGVVPFGHQGFDKRVASYPFSHRSAAENVAMNRGFGDVARIAVDGWIQSPGHRKNLLSRSIHCTIGVHQADNGAWYLTQLFAG
eukprot:TRINITY_DN3156_c0_g3_i2.p1 TRINITY_DN3156_c0_g3~~TRINITY_DN3156_c0_g3_i2.p1  ORF type:complete len:395 (-),score=77.37 TRINITY_DN3156_c0_g3_i2:140-1324(-)